MAIKAKGFKIFQFIVGSIAVYMVKVYSKFSAIGTIIFEILHSLFPFDILLFCYRFFRSPHHSISSPMDTLILCIFGELALLFHKSILEESWCMHEGICILALSFFYYLSQ